MKQSDVHLVHITSCCAEQACITQYKQCFLHCIRVYVLTVCACKVDREIGAADWIPSQWSRVASRLLLDLYQNRCRGQQLLQER